MMDEEFIRRLKSIREHAEKSYIFANTFPEYEFWKNIYPGIINMLVLIEWHGIENFNDNMGIKDERC